MDALFWNFNNQLLPSLKKTGLSWCIFPDFLEEEAQGAVIFLFVSNPNQAKRTNTTHTDYSCNYLFTELFHITGHLLTLRTMLVHSVMTCLHFNSIAVKWVITYPAQSLTPAKANRIILRTAKSKTHLKQMAECWVHVTITAFTSSAQLI